MNRAFVAAALARGRRQAAAGRLDAAARSFLAAGRADAGCAAAWISAAAVLARLGRDARAARALAALGAAAAPRWWDYGEWEKPILDDAPALADAGRLVAAAPGEPWRRLLRSLARRAALDYAGARADMDAAVAAAPGEAALLAMRGRARLLVGDALGVDDLRAACAALPDCGWTRAWLGEALRQRGELEAALTELDAAAALAPDYAPGRAWRGSVLRRLGRPAPARAELDLAIAADPAYAWARYERFLARRALGESAVFDDLDAAAAGDPRYGFVAHPGGPEAVARALNDLDAAVRASPRDARPLAWRGWTRVEAGDAAAGLPDLEAAVALAPRDGRARGWRGEALRRLGRRREAAAELSRAAALSPADAYLRARLGRALFETGGDALALKELSAAIALDPRCAWARQWRGEVLIALGRARDAREDFARALALNPGYEDARRGLAAVRIAASSTQPDRPDEERGEIHDLLLGYACDAACLFCSQEMSWRRRPALTTRQALEEIHAAYRRGVRRLGLLGGEITLRPDLETLFRFARRAGLRSIRVLTNGLRLADGEYARRLFDAGLDTVYFSLHGHEAALHDELVAVPGAFDKLVAGLRHFQDMGARVGVKVLVNRRNAPSLSQIARFVAQDLGVRDIGLTFPLHTGDFLRHRREMELSWTEAAASVRETLRVLDSLGPEAAQPPALHNFPPCVLPERLDLNCDLRPESSDLGGVAATGADKSEKRKAPACAACALSDRCPGADPAYLDARGDGELRPLEDAVSMGARALLNCGRHEAAVALIARAFGARPGRVFLARGLDPAQDLQLEADNPFAIGRRQWRRLGPALDRAAARWPASPVVLVARGAARVSAGLCSEALRDLDRAILLDPGMGAAFFWRYLARYLALDSQRRVDAWTEMLPDLDRAAALDPRDPVILSRRAEMRHNFERARQALDDAESALVLDPEAVWPRVERAEILQELGAKAEALAEYRSLKELHPKAGWAWAAWARALGKIGRFADSRRAFARAVVLSPRDSNVRAWLGELERKAGRPREALRHLSRALVLGPRNSYARMWRAKVLLAERRWGEAARDLTRSIRDDSRHLNLFALLAQARFQQGRFREASVLLDRVHPLNPRGAWIAGSGADREAALLAQLDRAVCARPGAAWPRAFRGRILVESPEPAARERGRRDLASAAELDPALGWAWAWRGESARQEGRLDRALEFLNRALSLEPERGLWRAWRGRVLLESARPREALADLDRAAALRPQDAEIFDGRGRARRELGLPDAEADLRRAEFLRMSLC